MPDRQCLPARPYLSELLQVLDLTSYQQRERVDDQPALCLMSAELERVLSFEF